MSAGWVSVAPGMGHAARLRAFAGGKALLAALLMVALLPGPLMADIALVFGTYAADKPTATVAKFRPLLDFLERRMSEELREKVTIRMRVDRTYGGAIARLAQGRVDFSRFGPASYVSVKARNPRLRIVAMETKDGQKRFHGVVVVHRDSPYRSLRDLDGQSFAFGDSLSTIGRYLAQAHLFEAGITSDSLTDFAYLGRHDLVGEAVGSGRFQAGALKQSTYQALVDKGVPLRVLHKFENVTKPWIAHPKVAPRVLAAMRRAMLAAENAGAIYDIAGIGFSPASDAEYDSVRDAMSKSVNF